MKFLLMVVAALAAFSSGALADGNTAGWAVQFWQDSFDQMTFPVGVVVEKTDNAFDKASLLAMCGAAGAITMGYEPGGIISFDQTSNVDVRADDATQHFTFNAGDVPHVGKQRILGNADSQRLIAIFEGSKGDVPFRSGTKKGTFPAIGAKEAFQIIKDRCPKR